MKKHLSPLLLALAACAPSTTDDPNEERPEVTACLNGGDVRVYGSRAYVACGGRFIGDGAIGVVSLETDPPTFERLIVTYGSPGSTAMAEDGTLFVGDMSDGSVRVVRADGSITRSVVCPEDPDSGLSMLGDLAWAGGRLFASCLNSDHVVEIDPATARRVGSPIEVGDGPQALAAVGGVLYVLDNVGGTMTPVELPTRRSHIGAVTLGQVPQAVAVSADGRLLVTNSGDGTVALVRPDGARSSVEGEVDLKRSGSGTPFPWGIAVDGDGRVFVALNGTDELASFSLHDAGAPRYVALQSDTGRPRPMGVAVAQGRVLVTLTNLNPSTHLAEGPAQLAVLDAQTLEVETMVKLEPAP